MEEYDIYISYAKEDNYPLQGAEQGWISVFQNYLKQILKQILKRQPFFLGVSNQIEPTSEDLKKIKVIILIISPEFLHNKGCQRDLENISKLRNKKLFKVIKTAYPEMLPSGLEELKSYDFSENNWQSGASLFSGSEDSSWVNQWPQLYNLAIDISSELMAQRIPKSNQKNRYIYLAETYSQNEKEKVLVKRELEKHGWIVLPNQKYPEDAQELERFVVENLAKCSTSIHLIGSVFAHPTTHPVSQIIELENRIAAEHCSKNSDHRNDSSNALKFRRFIWIAPELKKSDEKHKSFIENFLRNGESLEGAEILQTHFEDFKFTIRTNLERPVALTEANKINKNSIYLIYDKDDRKEAEELEDFFAQTGMEVLRPAFKGDLTEIRKQHFAHLSHCNATIILFGKVNEKWVQMKALDLLKCPAFGRVTPMDDRLIYSIGDRKFEKEFYKKIHIEVLEKRSDNLEKEFSSFLEKIRMTVNG